MVGSGRWIGVGLTIAVVSVFVWALLRNPDQMPGRGTATPALRVTATPGARVARTPRAGAIPAAEIKGSSISSVDEQGRRQWELYAESVTVDSTAGTAALTSVRGTYFQEGQPAISFTAPRGTFFINTRNVTLSGRVHARAASGYVLEADVVQWFAKTAQVEASGSVVLHQSGMTVHADRLTADVALKRTRLQGHIRVTVAE